MGFKRVAKVLVRDALQKAMRLGTAKVSSGGLKGFILITVLFAMNGMKPREAATKLIPVVNDLSDLASRRSGF